MRTKRKVRPNYTIKKGTTSTIKPTGSSSSTLWEGLIIIVLLVSGLFFVVASLENVTHRQHSADGPQPGQADSNAVPTKGVWERYKDPHNENYYYNTQTKQVVWKTPMEWKDGEKQKGWIRWYDTNSSSFFYENVKTKELVWEPPLEAFPEDVATGQTAESEVVETPETVVATTSALAETTTQCRQVWCRFKDANNMSFYQHKITKNTTWATPQIWMRKGELVPELKGDWFRIPNKNTVAKDAPTFYYYQQQTKVIQWDVPIVWKEVNSTEESASSSSSRSSGRSENSEPIVGLRGRGKPPQPPQPPPPQQQQLTTGVVEKGGWVQVRDSASSKFYYYRKGHAATTTTWETPKPFKTTGSHVAQTHVDGIVGQGWCRYYTVMENTDIKGGDVSLTGVRVKNVEECCGKCSSNIQCRSWSFSIDTCWMKNKLMAEEDDTRLVAKTGVESGYFLPVPPSI